MMFSLFAEGKKNHTFSLFTFFLLSFFFPCRLPVSLLSAFRVVNLLPEQGNKSNKTDFFPFPTWDE